MLANIQASEHAVGSLTSVGGVTILQLLERLEYLRISLWWRNVAQVKLLFAPSIDEVISFQRNGYGENLRKPVNDLE